MYYLLRYTNVFNQPVTFDTSSVTDMASMLESASLINQPLGFDTGSVTTMHEALTNIAQGGTPIKNRNEYINQSGMAEGLVGGQPEGLVGGQAEGPELGVLCAEARDAQPA